MLCGILTPSSGRGQVAGFDIYKETEKIKQNIGYMSQKFSLYEDLTIEENLDFYSGIYNIPPKIQRERKGWVLEMAGLQDRGNSLTRTLAGGWKQRLALGCAILHEPSVLFLDEPTSGVDPLSRRRFWELIYEMAHRGVTIFVTTHYMDEAEYCDRLALINQGRIIALGTPAQLKTEHMPEDVWELETGQLMETMGFLKTVGAVHEPPLGEVAVFGNTLHVVAPKGVNLASVIPSLLAGEGIAIRRLEQIEPSLEDVFVSLVEQKDRKPS
jgi:ABC-2 type transport system ATP-binding protein